MSLASHFSVFFMKFDAFFVKFAQIREMAGTLLILTTNANR